MVVLGVDFGLDNTVVAVVRQGSSGVEILPDKLGHRVTPSLVGLGGRQRLLGSAALGAGRATHTLSQFKQLLGLTYSQAVEAGFGEGQLVELEDQKAGLEVGGEVLRPEQLLAALLNSLVDGVGEEVEGVSLSCPADWDQARRCALLDAARLARLPAPRLLSDTAALARVVTATREPAQRRRVAVVDCGAGAVQAAMLDITPDRTTVESVASSVAGGGAALTSALTQSLAVELGADAALLALPRTAARLRAAAERVKHQLSGDPGPLPVSLDWQETEVTLRVNRARLEQEAGPALAAVQECLERLLEATPGPVDSVEMVGGGARVPAIRNIVQQVFSLQPGSSLNADEAVARGCALAAAAVAGWGGPEVVERVERGVEAVWRTGELQQVATIFNPGDTVGTQHCITVDSALSLALRYRDNGGFLALYQLDQQESRPGPLQLTFTHTRDRLLGLDHCTDVTGAELQFTETGLGGLPELLLAQLASQERLAEEKDRMEITRQEQKNRLEAELYRARAEVVDTGEEGTEAPGLLAEFTRVETWLYEEGELAPAAMYSEILESFHQKMAAFRKLIQIRVLLEQKKREEEKETKIEEEKEKKNSELEKEEKTQDARTDSYSHTLQGRRIPVVYSGETPYIPARTSRPYYHSLPGQRLGFGGPSTFYDDTLFGW